ncbi:hypothetical protein EHQ82_01715 [Leptospira selangorensis]|uniref:Ribosomal RNA large subunit methyltransferase E n=1 Tax=Leptospira selangorensis TaxID=2484982 RepID=A0ABY2NHQ1_9LEPT|nr:hypothetical protein EHQ82_01715 [Leptospira selangorensis]
MGYNPKDHYFKKAKEENFAARSVFKLEEIDKRYHLFKDKYQVLDLGASPGSWSQYSSPHRNFIRVFPQLSSHI